MYRLTDASAIEQRLLELAHTTDAKLTAPALAYFAPCSIDDAERVLEGLAARSRLTMEVEDDGTVVYQLPGRQKLAPRAASAPGGEAARRVLEPALVRVPPRHRQANPVVAAALSLLVPGAGHLYSGRVLGAFLWFLVVTAGYVLLLPGLVLHLFSIASAAASAHQLNMATRPLLLSPGSAASP